MKIRPERHGFKALPCRLLQAATLLSLILTWSGCSSKEAAQPEPVVTVQVAPVERKTIQRVVTAEALLYPLSQTTIDPKISAPIRKVYVERGSRVYAGELLASLDNRDLVAAVIQSKGAYEQAQAAYATSTEITLPAQIQAAELNVQATRQAMEADRAAYQSRLKLYQAGAMARNLMNQSLVTYIQSRNQYQIAESNLKALQSIGKKQQLKSAQAALTSAQGQYLAAEAQLSYSEIRSPISGVVASTPLYPGEMASAGTPLITVMNISHVVARVRISPLQAAQLRVGDAATIPLGEGQVSIKGRVSVVSPALDPNSTTVEVWVDAPNPGDTLKVGSTVQVSMVAQTDPNALVIPASAVLSAPDGSTSVMVAGSDGRAHQTQVKTGIHEGDEVQITSGLQEGQKVVIEGAYGLPDGTKVQF